MSLGSVANKYVLLGAIRSSVTPKWGVPACRGGVQWTLLSLNHLQAKENKIRKEEKRKMDWSSAMMHVPPSSQHPNRS
jgi:hypothetical protein